jgi:hypothetical protein
MRAMGVLLGAGGCGYLIQLHLPALPHSVSAERGVRLTLCTWLTPWLRVQPRPDLSSGWPEHAVVVHQEPDGENPQHKQHVHNGILHAASVFSLGPDQGARSPHAVTFIHRPGGAVICGGTLQGPEVP